MKLRTENQNIGIQERTTYHSVPLFFGRWLLGIGCWANISCRMFTPLVALFALVLALPLHAEVSIANIFGSSGIIQYGKPVPVWGLGDPGEKVTLTLQGIEGCQLSQSKEAVADRQGKWIVTLDPLTAGDKFHLRVNGKDSKAGSYNMQAGDVWFYAGYYRFRYLRSIPQITDKGWKEDNKDLFPLLRIYGTATKNSIEQRQENGRWKGPAAYNVFGFTPGIAIHLGIELCRDKKFPVGIVHVASLYGHWIDEYLSADAFVDDPVLGKTAEAKKLSYCVGYSDEGKQLNAQRIAYMDAYLTESIRRNADGKIVRHPDYPQPPEWADTKTSLLYNGAIHPMLPLAITGVIFNDPNGPRPFDATNHGAKLDLLVRSFRNWFNDPSLPVILVQAKAHNGQDTVRFDTRFAAQQRIAQMDPNVALAVMHDIEVFTKVDELLLKTIPAKGHRAYQMADRLAYGNSSASNSTPHVTGLSCEGTNMILRFTQPLQTFNGLDPDGFALAAKGQNVYRPANAKIEGNRIILSAPGIEEPENATYCYLNAAIEETPNVVGKNGMPVAAFSTKLLTNKGAK